jgi:predicted glycoside hydrolase/deacetylase ChbG (UPF0249 family)
MKQLIVNADDFGYSAGINRGIFAGHHRGIITSTTVLINGPEASAGLALARQDAPDLGFGLHLNLTWGRPVSPPDQVRSLVDDHGLFFGIRAWAGKLDTFDPEHLEREITAQFARFIDLAGQPPDHLDAHHHAIYVLPAALQTAVNLALEYELPLRNAGLDLTPQAAIQALQAMVPDLPEADAQRQIERLRAAASDISPRYWPARMELGFTQGKAATLGGLLVILTMLPEDSLTEIVCHAGYADQDPAHQWRENELNHLLHPATQECVKSEGIRLTTFGEMQSALRWNDDLRRDNFTDAEETGIDRFI